MRQAVRQLAQRVAPKASTSSKRTGAMGTKAAASSTPQEQEQAAAAGVVMRRSARLIAASDVSAGRRRALSTSTTIEGDARAVDASDPPAKCKRQKAATTKKQAVVVATTVTTTSADDEEAAVEEKAGAVLFKHGTLSRSYEIAKIAKGYKMVVGVDEAGRGPLAGPVVAAACYVPVDVVVEGVHDSKKLNEEQREVLYDLLANHPRIKWAVHVNSAQRIDEINILQASLESMVKAAEALDETPDFVFVDGNRMPPTIKCDAETVVKGDSKVYSIAAASIIAKVTRDRIMVEYDAQYPQYNLKQHKGYPTKDHMAAIVKHGACEIHRMTFAPLKPKDGKKKAVATAKKATKPKAKAK